MNKFNSLIISLVIVAETAAKNFKVGVISDPHYNKYYNPLGSTDDNCIETVESKSDYPIGRYECDNSPPMFHLLMQRFQAEFGEIDMLLVPGDHVAHKVSSKSDDKDHAAYYAVKQNLQDTWDMFTEYFPNTMILPTLGNNDGRFHDQAIDESDKSDYYDFLNKLWFTDFAGNQSFNLSQIEEGLATAGYYRADVTSKLTVLQMNSMYVACDDTSTHDGEQSEILDWFEEQLIAAHADQRKVIVLDHEYAGNRYKDHQLWTKEYNERYFELIRDYHEQVIIEVGGHDHYADLRYHSSYNVASLKDTDEKFYFHNLFVAPGATPYGKSNPGVSVFELDSELRPLNLRMEFLDLDATFGMDSVPYDQATWWSIDYSKDYGVEYITPDSLHEFYLRLKDQSEDDTVNYLVSKLGFNPNDEFQYEQGIDLLASKDLITSKKHHVGEFLCLMNHNSDADEYKDCTDKANAQLMIQ